MLELESMDKLQLISRAVLIENGQILLVKKKDADFWHYPGGKWEIEEESLLDCVCREVREETGYEIIVDNIIWFQEIRKPGKVYVELFWEAKLSPTNNQNVGKIDKEFNKDEDIEQICWFNIKDLGTIKILPKTFRPANSPVV